jgi:hypothetical protein
MTLRTDEFSSEKIVVHGKKGAKTVVVLFAGMELVTNEKLRVVVDS